MKTIFARLLPALLMPSLIGSTSAVRAQSYQSQSIVNEQFRVAPAGYTAYPFEVDEGRMRDAVVVGRFEAAGGNGNDIEVVVAEREGFLNWVNGHGGSILYASGKKTTGKVAVRVQGAGQYVVAFNNKFSLLTAKNVAANINLAFLPR
jgi:hypothetical protein